MLPAGPLAPALLAAALLAPQAASDPTQVTPRSTLAELRLRKAAAPYLQAVAEYRAGRTKWSVRTSLSWSREDLQGFLDAIRGLAGRLRPCPSQPDEIPMRALEAAALLHVDAALEAWRDQDHTGFATHTEFAEKMFEWQRLQWGRLQATPAVRAIGCPIEAIPSRAFYLAVSRVLLGCFEPANAEVFAARGLRMERRDPDLLLAAATACEAQALGLARYVSLPSAGEQPDIRKLRGDAEKHLREAIAAAPGLSEARLRLGRVLTVSGDLAEAATELEWVVRHTADPAQRYLAHLFLGAVRDAQGRVAQAAEEYQRATQERPEGQAARFALAHARASAGDRTGARGIVLGALGDRWPKTRREDPWWEYPYGRWEEGERQLQELRLRVRER